MEPQVRLNGDEQHTLCRGLSQFRKIFERLDRLSPEDARALKECEYLQCLADECVPLTHKDLLRIQKVLILIKNAEDTLHDEFLKTHLAEEPLRLKKKNVLDSINLVERALEVLVKGA